MVMLTNAFLILLTVVYALWSISHLFQIVYKLFSFPLVFDGNPILVWIAFIVILFSIKPAYVILPLIISMILGRRLLSFMGLFQLEFNCLAFTILCIIKAAHAWFPQLKSLETFSSPAVDFYLNFFRNLIPSIANVDFSIFAAITIASIPYIILKMLTDQAIEARDKKNIPKRIFEKSQNHAPPDSKAGPHKSPTSIFQQGFSKNRK